MSGIRGGSIDVSNATFYRSSLLGKAAAGAVGPGWGQGQGIRGRLRKTVESER